MLPLLVLVFFLLRNVALARPRMYAFGRTVPSVRDASLLIPLFDKNQSKTRAGSTRLKFSTQEQNVALPVSMLLFSFFCLCVCVIYFCQSAVRQLTIISFEF